jgi:hypothetical protein
MTIGEGEIRGAAVKPKFQSWMSDIEQRTQLLLNEYPQPETQQHFGRRLQLLKGLHQCSNISADPHSCELVPLIGELNRQTSELSQPALTGNMMSTAKPAQDYDRLATHLSHFARKTGELVAGHENYADPTVYPRSTNRPELVSQAERPAFAEYSLLGTVVNDEINDAIDLATLYRASPKKEATLASLKSLRKTVYRIVDAAEPHMQDMYGIPYGKNDDEGDTYQDDF